MTLRLHVNTSTPYTELNLKYNRHFFPTRDENLILCTRKFLGYLYKKKDFDFTRLFFLIKI